MIFHFSVMIPWRTLKLNLKRLRVPGFRKRMYSGNQASKSNKIKVKECANQQAIEKIKRILFAEQLNADNGLAQDGVEAAPRGIKSDQIGLSLSGCGFLGTYHFGVMICFQKNAKNLLSRISHFGGSSAGSLMAALLVLAPESLETGLAKLYELADELNTLPLGALTPGFQLALKLSNVVDHVMPDDISSSEGRLFVSLTKQSDKSNRLVSIFSSREYLMKCLMASCYIPIYSMGYYGTPPEIDGELYIDGGYSSNLPIFENIPTITVSPFSGSAIIAPADVNSMFDWKMRLGNQYMKVNLNNIVRGAQALFPPNRSVLTAYYELGFRDAMKFLQDNGFFERAEGDPV